MKFSVAAATILVPTLVSGAALVARVNHPTDADCIGAGKNVNNYSGAGAFDRSCPDVVGHCQEAVKSSQTGLSTTDIWNLPLCVAAAACHAPDALYTLASCQNKDLPNRSATKSMTPDNWKKIVGSCGTGCAMTQQNFVDFVYGQMSSFGATNWPESTQFVIDNWWTPMKTWVNKGETVPFNNFNDWLHFA